MDAYNLPPGTRPSDLPGNSRREVAATAAMEKAEVRVNNILAPLQTVVVMLDHAFDGRYPEDCKLVLRDAGNRLEAIQEILDDVYHTLGQVCSPPPTRWW